MTSLSRIAGDARARTPHAVRERLRATAERRLDRSADVATRFFDAEAERIARACLEMARRFQQGGRLLAFGDGAAATDAQHVAVEFVHPVLVGKRALPALALTSDVAAITGLALSEPLDGAFGAAISVLGRAEDIAMGISHGAPSAAVANGLHRARTSGLLTIALGAADGATDRDADFPFAVPSSDACIVQEVHETMYHVLWELVHVFFEHRVA